MPRSRKRKKHHDYQPPANAVKSKKNRSAIPVGIVFLGIIGIGIAYFAGGSGTYWMLWLLLGAIIGCIAGYYFGRQINRSFAKK